jgi:Flp pilus assembly protein TadD
MVYAVAFSPNGQAVLTGSLDGTARLWSAASGQALTPPLRHRGPVTAVAFSPDGKVLLTACRDKTVRLWPMPVALKEDPQRIKLWSQVLTGTEMDDRGELHVLDARTWQQRRQQFTQRGGSPLPEIKDVFSWHRRQAIEAEVAGQWFAAAWHLARLCDAAPADCQLWEARAQAHVQLEQWAKASFAFAKASQLPGADVEVGARHALLRLHLADEKGYKQACATLLQRWGSAKDPQTMNTVAGTCALGPSALPDLGQAVRLAETAVRKMPNSSGVLNTLGAILYRADRYEEAKQRLKESVAKSPGNKGTAEDWLFLTMVHQKLSQTGEAKSCLAKAAEMVKAKGIPWNQRLEFQILYRQAEALVKANKQ